MFRREASLPGAPRDAGSASALLKIGLIVGGLVVVSCGGLGVFQLAIQSVHVDARRIHAENNLRQIGVALALYAKDYGEFPPAVVYDAQGRPLYSWRVLLLPYLDESKLAAEFRYDEPWDSPHNQKLLNRCPKVYRLPVGDSNDPSITFFRVFDGPGAAFESDPTAELRPLKGGDPQTRRSLPKIGLTDFPDGLENTFLVVEAAQGVPWTKPDELLYALDKPFPPLGGHFPRVFLALFADGHTDRLKIDTPEPILRAFVTRNGHDPAPVAP